MEFKEFAFSLKRRVNIWLQHKHQQFIVCLQFCRTISVTVIVSLDFFIKNTLIL